MSVVTPSFFDWIGFLKSMAPSVISGLIMGFIKWGIKAIKNFWKKWKCKQKTWKTSNSCGHKKLAN
jgi:hypothetical protein